ncbi:MAG: hypothetical protein ACW98Y_14555 [Candidatus Thorarchaeota archaeon]|jgi:hypothetical protein
MEDMIQEWKKELIEAGLIKPGEEISQMELMQLWSEYQSKKMKQQLSGIAEEFGVKGEAPSKHMKTEPASSKSDDLEELRGMMKENPELAEQFAHLAKSEAEKLERKGNVREGIKLALEALLTKAKGASYCMIVADRAWINFRHKKSKDNLHLQVAGNQYISPMELDDSDIKKLEAMGIPPEEGSVDIWATDFDDTPRNLDKIVDTALTIFNEVYKIKDGKDAYVELDLGKGDDESVRKDIAQYFEHRDENQFKWDWDTSV